MNKKFSTLLTMGLLMAGSLFSMANAQAVVVEGLPIGSKVTDFKSGKTYFVVQSTDATLDAGDFLLGFAKVTSQPTQIGKNATTALAGNSSNWKTTVTTTDDNLQVKSYLWTVKEEKNSGSTEFYYTFTNALTGKTLMLDASKALVEDYVAGLTGTISKFTLASDASVAYGAGGTVLTVNGAANAADGLLLTEGGIELKENPSGAGGNFYLYEVAPTPVEASDLNDAAKGAFTLKYDKSTNNPFSGSLRAFQVSTLSGSGIVDGTYFATSWPASLNGKDEISGTSALADFKKCTFIAANPQSNYKINDLDIDGGEGFGFINVKGSMLLTTPSDVTAMKKGYILSNNAAFAVEQEYGNTTDYQLSLKGASFISKDGKSVKTISGELIIAALNDQQGKYVTTVQESNANFDSYTTTCTIDAANLQTVDKLLSTDKASVFNIKFLSKNAGDNTTTVSEYNKYLGVNGATEVFFAQGADFVNLDAPENQWIIVDADKDNNIFTFQNRDLVGQTFDVQLVKTDKDNVYTVIDKTSTPVVFNYAWVDKTSKAYTVSSSADGELADATIELTAVTVDPAAGFVTNQLDDAGLIKFVATSDQKLIANKLYLGEGEAAPLEMHQNGSAYLWTIVKSEVAPYESYNDYAYYNATDKKVETKLNADTIKVSLFSFKQYGVDDTYLTVNSSDQLEVAKADNSEDAQQFLIKANKNGTYSLIPVEATATDYRDVVADEDAKTFSVDDDDATVDNNTNGASAFYNYEQTYILTIEKEELTPSLKHEPNYVALNASNRGYVAMDSVLFEGIVAPVSSLKSAYTAEELTFRLDTADTDAIVPAFYISHKGNFMYNAKDSADYYNDGTASAEGNRNYLLKDSQKEYVKAIFRAATLVASDTLATTVDGKDAAVTVNKTKETLGGLNNFKFNIVQQTKDSEGEYVIKSVNDRLYLFNLNGFLGFTSDAAKALVVNVEQSEAPVANEAVTTSSIKVIAGNGVITVIGAQGKKVAVSNVLGQTIANTVLSSDNATINVPAGIVIVAVEGEAAVKAIVK